MPLFVAVQCVDGPWHTRDAAQRRRNRSGTWLRLALGLLGFEEARQAGGGVMEVSGTRAGELAKHLPVVRLG